MPKSGQNRNCSGVLVDLRRALVQKHFWESVHVRGWLELALGPNPVRNRLLVLFRIMPTVPYVLMLAPAD